MGRGKFQFYKEKNLEASYRKKHLIITFLRKKRLNAKITFNADAIVVICRMLDITDSL